MSRRRNAGAWTGLFLAALCLMIVGYVFHASAAQGSEALFITDSVATTAR